MYAVVVGVDADGLSRVTTDRDTRLINGCGPSPENVRSLGRNVRWRGHSSDDSLSVRSVVGVSHYSALLRHLAPPANPHWVILFDSIGKKQKQFEELLNWKTETTKQKRQDRIFAQENVHNFVLLGQTIHMTKRWEKCNFKVILNPPTRNNAVVTTEISDVTRNFETGKQNRKTL